MHRASLFLARRASHKTGRVDNPQTRLWLIPLGAAALGGALSACADMTRLGAYAPEGVDPRSASAGVVAEAAGARHPYPDLRRLPRAPAVTPPTAFAARADDQRAARARLQRWTETNPAQPVDTETYAGAQSGRVLDPARESPPEDQAARSEAWAARLRNVAKPPPPPSL